MHGILEGDNQLIVQEGRFDGIQNFSLIIDIQIQITVLELLILSVWRDALVKPDIGKIRQTPQSRRHLCQSADMEGDLRETADQMHNLLDPIGVGHNQNLLPALIFPDKGVNKP